VHEVGFYYTDGIILKLQKCRKSTWRHENWHSYERFHRSIFIPESFFSGILHVLQVHIYSLFSQLLTN